jgi:hypothetical protein
MSDTIYRLGDGGWPIGGGSGQYSHNIHFEKLTTPPVEWRPVGGDSIELGDTGFRIVLIRDKNQYPYAGHDPEGRHFGAGYELTMLKEAAERFARHRAEFALPAGAWKGLV